MFQLLFAPDKTDYRYERKFLVSDQSLENIWQIIKNHPACFKPIFEPRQINNLYFDSPQSDHYQKHVDGVSQRLKVRLRWYGSLDQSTISPRLELKIKRNQLGRKVVYNLNKMSRPERWADFKITELLKQNCLPELIRKELGRLQISSFNSYQRQYWKSADKKFRVTVDHNLKFLPLFNFIPTKNIPRPIIIVELKYKAQYAKSVSEITNYWPFRLNQFSKYVMGID